MPRPPRTKTASSASTAGALRRRFRPGGPDPASVVLADGTLAEIPPTAPPQAAAAATETSARPAPSGRTMLLVDLRGGLMLMNEARYRTVVRLFGVRRDQVNMTTVIAFLVAAETARRRTERYKPSRRPKLADFAIGAGALRESIYGVAGPAASDTPLAGSLIALAILGGLVRPPVVRSVREMRASSRRLHHAFRGRYGHLVGQSRPD